MVLQGVMDAPDAHMQRQCIAVMHRLVDTWGRSGEADGALTRGGHQGGFAAFALAHVAPAYLKALLHPYLDLKDAAASPLLEALAGAQQGLGAVLGPTYTSFLTESALPAVGCSPDLAASFATHVATPPAGRPLAFRDFLHEFAATYQSSRQHFAATG